MEQQETEQQKKEKLAPWLDRFMKMANAMYGVDAHNTGELGNRMTSWHRTEARSVDVNILSHAAERSETNRCYFPRSRDLDI